MTMSGKTNDNEWHNEWQQVTTSDNKWKLLKQMTMSDSEWQGVVKWMKTNENKKNKVILSFKMK